MAHGKAWMVFEKRCWPACFDCFSAYRTSLKREVYRRESGRAQSLVDPDKSCRLIREMVDTYGRQNTWIAKNLGMSTKTVIEMHRGHRVSNGQPLRGVFPKTERKIARLHERVVAEGKWDRGLKSGMVPARLAMLGVQGLIVQGWDSVWIAERLGSAPRPIVALSNGQNQYVTEKRHNDILNLVREVGSKRGPSRRSMTIATRKGWKPTMYWDELV